VDFGPPLGRMRAFEELSATRDGRTRAVLKIQDGCVNFCSYCIIPYARGPLRSRPLASIRRELTALGEAGYREVILTGIHLASWGIDSGEGTLADVLVLADGIPGIRRVRLGSLEPTLIDEAFMRTVSGLKTTCGQFHLSLQSGSDAVLRRMNRRYTVKEFARSAELIRAFMPGAAITTDVIAGFAGETEEEHRETMRFLEEIAFARIHVLPFSVRKGTAAEKTPGQLPRRVREKRAAELIRLGRSLEEAYLDGLAGKTLEVLAESDGTGYSREYARVRTDAPEGGIVRILAKGREGLIMYGEEI
jgi:threonylcarbamoyladenosine tRNA methylthiotransferase MtaB